MIPYKPRTATTMPKTLEKRLEVMAALRTLAAQEDEQLRQRRAEIAALRRELEQMARSLPAICREWALSVRSQLRKYSPDQPRVPAGNPDDGQWTSDGQYAANDEDAAAASDNLTPEQICRQAYSDGMASVRMSPSLSPTEYVGARYQLTSALELCLNYVNGVRPISRNGNFVEFFGAGVVIFRPGIPPFYVPFPRRQ
ncbi:MAG: hypothetical protein ABSC37_15565 [Xanthobacteraceae bacterium]|jgi:hypothetical protein